MQWDVHAPVMVLKWGGTRLSYKGGVSRTVRRTSRVRVGRLGLAALAATTVSGIASLGGGTAGAASSSKAPYTIVMITSLTGEGGSEFSNTPAGFNARIALQNAEGGV